MDFIAKVHAVLFFNSGIFYFFFPQGESYMQQLIKLLQSWDMNSWLYVTVLWDSVEPSRQLQTVSYLFISITIKEFSDSKLPKGISKSGMGPCLQECISAAKGNYVMAASSQTTVPFSPTQFLTCSNSAPRRP